MNTYKVYRNINILYIALLLLASFSFPKNISKLNTKENQGLKDILDLQPSKSSSFLSTSTSSSSKVLPMENSGYLFYGYNLFRGNPHSTTGSIDPGFTNPIFESNYSQRILTGDLRFLIPNGSIFSKNVGCDVSLTSKEITGASSYKSALDVDVSVTGSFWGVSFAASSSFNEVTQNMKSSRFAYIEQKADCRVFQGHIEYYKPPLFYETFIIAFQYLHDKEFEKYKSDYYTFIDYYGTHFLEKIIMGARYGFLHKVEIDDFNDFKESLIKVSASGSGYGFGASASVGSKSSSSNSSSNSNVSTKVFSIGAPPNAKGDPMAWANSVIQEPMPISYKLRPIMDILTNPFFNLSQLKSKNIDIKNLTENLKKAYENYCNDYLKKNGKLKYCSEKEIPKEIKIPDDEDDDDDQPEKEIQLGGLRHNIMFRNLETNTCLMVAKKFFLASRCDEKNSSQRFTVVYHSDTVSYRILSPEVRGDVADRDSDKFSELQPWRSHDRDNQRVTFYKIDTNVYSIVIKDQCLNVKNNNKADNAPLSFSHCRTDKSQSWKISI